MANWTTPTLCTLLLATLTACGGGGGEQATAAASGAVAAPGATASIATTAAPWVHVAGEGQAFSVSGTRTVRYGAANAWVHRELSQSGECSNSFFGADPAFGMVKTCEVLADSVASIANPSPAPDPAPSPAPAPAPDPAPPPAPVPDPAPDPGPAPTLGSPLDAARIFISGHSLTDNPLPEDIAAIAQSLSTRMLWNQQNVVGSPIRARTRGGDLNDPTFGGYRGGKNREGMGMNVVSELRSPQTINGERYDTLILTERHDLLDVLNWEDTVRYTRHFHERLIEGNRGANTYLYHAWLSLTDKNDPRNWIAYERAAAPVWQCVASRINQSLSSEGRSDRITYLPAGLALAKLIERATQGSLAGISAGSVRATVDSIVNDDVHLTRMGIYYMALVNYASVYRRSPVGAWAPAGVSATQARSLQDVAWDAVANHYASATNRDLAQCRALLRDSFCSTYHNYRNTASQAAGCSSWFSRETADNPLFFNAATDRAYWFAPPQ